MFYGMGRAWRFLKALGAEAQENQALDLAAQLAYWSLLALVPFAMFLMTIIGYLPLEGLRGQLLGTMHAVMPGPAATLFDGVLGELVGRQHGWLLLASLVGALWTAAGGTGALITALNRSYEVKETRAWWRVKLLSLWFTTAAVVSVVIASIGLIVGPDLVHTIWSQLGLGGAFEVLWRWLRWPVVIFALMFMIANAYYFLPNVRGRRWRLLTPGAIAAVLLWLAASLVFNVYVTHFNSYAKSYGALGAIVIMMTWLYLSGFTVILGGEINALLERRRRPLQSGKRRSSENGMRINCDITMSKPSV